MHALGREAGLFEFNPYDERFAIAEIDRLQQQGRLRGWQAKQEVSRILAEVNEFADETADGDLDAWAATLSSPTEIVNQIAHGIHYQGRDGTGARKKAWVWLRWMVRPSPDLRRWTHLDPADLTVPVDRHVGGFAARIGLIAKSRVEQPSATDARTVTSWAAKIFPTDPAKVDYALYLHGRGRTRQPPRDVDRDTCYSTLKQSGRRCPLASTPLRCGMRCPS